MYREYHLTTRPSTKEASTNVLPVDRFLLIVILVCHEIIHLHLRCHDECFPLAYFAIWHVMNISNLHIAYLISQYSSWPWCLIQLQHMNNLYSTSKETLSVVTFKDMLKVMSPTCGMNTIIHPLYKRLYSRHVL